MSRKRAVLPADIGEDALVARLTRGMALAGDDCAVVRSGQGFRLLKADAVVEGVHFALAEDPRRVGWKAFCRPLSDIGAMGGVPERALVTLGMPGDREVRWAEGLYAGMRRAARRFRVEMVGGETVLANGGAFVSVTVEGRAKRPVLRSGGSVGDVLFVTGVLGGSILGHHLDFVPRLAEGMWLAERGYARAMMDLSDGLGADLPRLAAASGCGFAVEEAALPLRPGCDVRAAWGDGEDYELLFAVAPSKAERLEERWRWAFPRVRLTRIGCLTGRSRMTTRGRSDGYDPFRMSP